MTWEAVAGVGGCTADRQESGRQGTGVSSSVLWRWSSSRNIDGDIQHESPVPGLADPVLPPHLGGAGGSSATSGK